MTPEAAQALLFWEPVSPRLLMARFNSIPSKILTRIILERLKKALDETL